MSYTDPSASLAVGQRGDAAVARTNMIANPKADPGLFELVGLVSDLLGLGEHAQLLFPLDRLRAQRRHKRVAKLRDQFRDALEQARTSLRALRSSVDATLPQSQPGETTRPTLSQTDGPVTRFDMSLTELPVFLKAVLSIQAAIQRMTKAAYELESATASIPHEVERYFRISEAGTPVLRALRDSLDHGVSAVPALLERIDRYLSKCSDLLRESENWREL